ncbi:adenine-specific methyltransferase EcoRI family protein [Flavobacterium psychrophilum]|uniref:adenine-specific methyltransferase EcoRI family protein n=1 Tax=Flavobacterium psychrophilum TaxID=96345 RepID=UPI0004F607EF|nr:adenine-specific methyltransferase EcoRI family protein [Flavobacterium psychrophilum]AIN74114.1 modification methylase [Flavobacterium psychrophilum FPG3]EKT2068684.1 adenine-specific methyltransferase EcoRI family protein [Flavobacterium psychrophilum]EKT2070788.1 adenine-specific methyltransferase EcoRI family protein [Flavobacterium psychrophilum]EKT4490297.1 adenine-specific methyltransferase EcoRI family protein [Flavobacterium psychrophilum]EKT4537809.1 adenine-specific methyltransfe
MAEKAKNKNLHKAKDSKKDEFYTQLSDIEKELRHYKEHFKDKVVFCNCDDPRVSNFFHYFSYNFENLGLKKLITTCYKNQERDLFSENKSEKAIYLEYNGDKNGNRVPDAEEIGIIHLKGDGDFRSQESIDLLTQADIVVTNPPFSLFREYVTQLVQFDKKFIIVGHQNAITYKEIFKLIKEDKLWLGYGFNGGAAHFINKHYEDYATATDRKEGMIRVSGVTWFTNLEIRKRHEDLELYKSYTPEEFPTYENFNAINIGKTKEIPVNYNGFMGVPITFLDKYNPEQFEIIGLGISSSGIEFGVEPYKDEHKKYRKEIQKRGAVNGDLYMITNGIVDVPYARIVIKNKRL